MKLLVPSLRRGLLATALSLITFTAVSAADSFEGRIHMDMTGGKKKETVGLDYAIKDGKMRMDPQMQASSQRGGSVGMIVDPKSREIIILMDNNGRKMFMRRPFPQTAPANSPGHEGIHRTPPAPTGRTEVIAGYTATEYRSTEENGNSVEFWLARGLGPFMSMGGNPMAGRGAPPPGWENFARDGNFFPMRVVTRDAKGVEQSRLEVTKVDRTSLPDSLFSTDGYNEFKMPDFGGGFNPYGQH